MRILPKITLLAFLGLASCAGEREGIVKIDKGDNCPRSYTVLNSGLFTDSPTRIEGKIPFYERRESEEVGKELCYYKGVPSR